MYGHCLPMRGVKQREINQHPWNSTTRSEKERFNQIKLMMTSSEYGKFVSNAQDKIIGGNHSLFTNYNSL